MVSCGTVEAGVFLLFLVSVGTLLTVFGLLSGTTTAMRTSNVLFLLGFGFHLAVVVFLFSGRAKHQSATLNDFVYLCHTVQR